MTTTTQATGTIRMGSWEEEVYGELEGAPKLSQDRVTHTFSGDIEGEGTARYLNAYQDEATALYAGYERVVGRLGRRTGSFVLAITGEYAGGVARSRWTVVPGSGTGELRGLLGEGGCDSGGDAGDGYSYRLDHRFE
jgi:hypothetical protein